MIKLTKSQKVTLREIETGLQDREIVCLWGNVPNGKTHIHSYLVGNYTIGLENIGRAKIIPSHEENNTIEVLEGVEITTISEKIHIDRIKRNILEIYGEPFGGRLLDMHRRFINLLLDLKEAHIVPVLAQDGIEILPRRAYSIYKLLNQMYHKGEHIGVGCLLSGDFSKRRMPENFWLHIKEVKVGKVMAEEVQDFLSEVAPGHKHLFTTGALEKLATCPTTAEMRRLIRASVHYWKTFSSEEKIDTAIIRSASDDMLYAKRKIAA
jgi:hypothetical protein